MTHIGTFTDQSGAKRRTMHSLGTHVQAANVGASYYHVQWFGRPVENASGISLLRMHS